MGIKKQSNSRIGRESRCGERIPLGRNDISQLTQNMKEKAISRIGVRSLDTRKKEKIRAALEINTNQRSSEHIQTKFDEISRYEEFLFGSLIQNLKNL